MGVTLFKFNTNNFEHATFNTLNKLPKIKISNLKQLKPILINQFVDEQFNFEN